MALLKAIIDMGRPLQARPTGERMSILYNGNYRIIDLQKWHTWWPWVPVQLTEDWGWQRGPWRWLYAVERKLNYEASYEESDKDWRAGRDPRAYPTIWQYRDIGERNAEFGFEGLATA